MKILQTISSLSAKSGGPSTCTLDLLNGLYDITLCIYFAFVPIIKFVNAYMPIISGLDGKINI